MGSHYGFSVHNKLALRQVVKISKNEWNFSFKGLFHFHFDLLGEFL